MKVLITVEVNIEPVEEIYASISAERLRQTAREAVENALMLCQANGFSHALDAKTSILVNSVGLTRPDGR